MFFQNVTQDGRRENLVVVHGYPGGYQGGARVRTD